MSDFQEELIDVFYPGKINLSVAVALTSVIFLATFFLGGLDFPFSMVRWVEPSDPFALGPSFGGLNFVNVAINMISAYILASFSSMIYKKINERDLE